MSEYITFVGLDPDGNVLDRVVVTVYDQDNALVVHDMFGPGTPETGINKIAVPIGSYVATVRADGYIFPFRSPFFINVGDGATASNPRVIAFQGRSSVRPPGEVKCRVFGWIERGSPNSVANVERQSHGTTFDDGPTRHTALVAHSVSFNRVGASKAGEQRSLVDKARTRVSVDRHGFYEAELEPNAVYTVSVPNVVGLRYIVTPGPGAEANVEDLVDASRTIPLYELV